MKKLLTLFTLLLTVCSGAWATAGDSASDPATKTLNGQVFLDVANTPYNATITSGTVRCVTYGIYYLCAATSSGWRPSWVGGATSNMSSGESSGTADFSAQGFLPGASSNLSTAAERAVASGYGYSNAKQADNNTRYIYVTGITGVAMLNKDDSNASRNCILKVEEYNQAGTATTDLGTTTSGNNTSYHVTEYNAASLSGDKYYKITLSGSSSGGGCGQESQIRFTKYSAPTVPSISADDVEITYNATSGSIGYSVSNPADGVMTATSEAGWLSAFTNDGENSEMDFTATANTGIERSATVTLTYTYNTDKTVTKEVTVTQAAPSYAITYNPGSNGTGSIEAGEKAFGVAFTLSSEMFTRDGYLQIGWATSDGGDKAYDLGGSYTTDAAQTFYPVWAEKDTYVAAFSYDSENPATAPEGWTFANAGTYGANDATVAYEGAFGATCPASGDSKNDNYIAFAKNTGSYAKYDLGISTTVSNVTGTFYVGSGNPRTFTITYHDADNTVLKTVTVNHPAGNNWGADNVNETSVVPNVRYIKVNGMTSDLSWIVMSAFSVTFGNPNPATKYTVTYDLNGGEGTTPTQANTKEGGSFTLHDGVTGITAPDGKMFVAWNDGTNNYDGGALYTMPGENVTLTAQWEEIINDYSFTPATSGGAPSVGDEFNTSTGGTMTKVGGTITYDPLGLYFQSSSSSVVKIELNNHRFKAGTIITGVLTNGGTTSKGRGCKIKTNTGDDVSKDGAIWTWDPAETNEEKTFSYTVQTGDGIIGTNSFCLGRVNNFYLKSLTVTNAELVSVPVTIGDAGYASFASTSALDFTDSGITAYIATANGTDNVTMTEIAKVPANTGVVLKGTKGTVNVPVLTGDADDTTYNLLKPGEKTVTEGEATAGTIYAFGKKGGQVGFVKAHAGFTITAGKAYLDLSGTGGAKDVEFLSFVFGDEGEETDGIKAVSTTVENGVRYNLAGQKVGADYKGIVIVNGKKVIIK